MSFRVLWCILARNFYIQVKSCVWFSISIACSCSFKLSLTSIFINLHCLRGHWISVPCYTGWRYLITRTATSSVTTEASRYGSGSTQPPVQWHICTGFTTLVHSCRCRYTPWHMDTWHSSHMAQSSTTVVLLPIAQAKHSQAGWHRGRHSSFVHMHWTLLMLGKLSGKHWPNPLLCKPKHS